MTRLAVRATAGLAVAALGLSLSGCLAQGTRVTTTVTTMAPTGPTGAPTASASEVPVPDDGPAPTLGAAVRGLAGAVARVGVGSSTLVALAAGDAGRLVLLAGGRRDLGPLPGVPLALAATGRASALVLLADPAGGTAAALRTITWRPTGRAVLGRPQDAPGAVALAADGTPVAVDASGLSTDDSPAVVTVDADRVWGVVGDGTSLRLGVGELGSGSAPVELTPVTAWASTTTPTAVVATEGRLWVGTDDGTLWRLDTDAARAGNPVGYPLVDGAVGALVPVSPSLLWATSGAGEAVRTDEVVTGD